MELCQCPAAPALPDLPNVTCAQTFGQIQKVAFQRLQNAQGVNNTFKSTADITKLASWETFLSADDGTKIVVTPYVYSPADSGGDARMSSGGNDDLGGIPTVLGGEPVQFTASLRAIPQDVAKALKQLICESNARNLGVYLFDQYGNIEAIKVAENEYAPIPIQALFVGDKIHGNYDAQDSNTLSWYYQADYSDSLEIVAPAFNPLTELKNA